MAFFIQIYRFALLVQNALKKQNNSQRNRFFYVMGTSCTDKCFPAFFLRRNTTCKNVYRPQKVGGMEQFHRHQW